MSAVFFKEFSSFFNNATGYVVIGIFLLLTGLFLWIIPGQFNVLDAGYANVDGLFVLAPWLFLFLCPAITMRFFAEEKQTGTWDLLITKPVSPIQITAGKFLAGTSLVFIALAPTVIYYFITSYLAQPQGNIDTGQFWGAFIGLFFLAMTYIAIGTFTSSLTANELTAFIMAATISFFFYYGFELITAFFVRGSYIHQIENFGIHVHYQSISRGVVDSKDIAYFLLVSVLFLWLTVGRVKKQE